MEELLKRPPLGLRPEWIHDEKRLVEISVAITLYMGEGKEVPLEWIREYNKLAKKVIRRSKTNNENKLCQDT